jgi:hypothetical protein
VLDTSRWQQMIRAIGLVMGEEANGGEVMMDGGTR